MADSFEGNDYTVCRFDLRQDHLRLYSLDKDGQPYGSFSALSTSLMETGQTLAFAMNAGMYGEDLKPIGLYIEDGKTLRKLNRRGRPRQFPHEAQRRVLHQGRQRRRHGDRGLRRLRAEAGLCQPVRPHAGDRRQDPPQILRGRQLGSAPQRRRRARTATRWSSRSATAGSISTASRGCSAITSTAPTRCSSTARSRASTRPNCSAAIEASPWAHRGAGKGPLKPLFQGLHSYFRSISCYGPGS